MRNFLNSPHFLPPPKKLLMVALKQKQKLLVLDALDDTINSDLLDNTTWAEDIKGVMSIYATKDRFTKVMPPFEIINLQKTYIKLIEVPPGPARGFLYLSFYFSWKKRTDVWFAPYLILEPRLRDWKSLILNSLCSIYLYLHVLSTTSFGWPSTQ